VKKLDKKKSHVTGRAGETCKKSINLKSYIKIRYKKNWQKNWVILGQNSKKT